MYITIMSYMKNYFEVFMIRSYRNPYGRKKYNDGRAILINIVFYIPQYWIKQGFLVN